MLKRILPFILIPLLFSCKKDSQDIVVNTPVSTGTVSGKVRLIDEYNREQGRSLDGISVSLEGTGFSARTDTGGYYSISGVPQGTYTLDCNKDGYGDFKNYNINFSGGGQMTVPPALLVQKPTYTFSNLKIDVNKKFSPYHDSMYVINFTADANVRDSIYSTTRSYMVVVAPDPSVTPAHGIAVGSWYLVFPSKGKTKVSGTIQLYSSNLLYSGKLYFMLYPSCSQMYTYFDVREGRDVLTAFGPSVSQPFIAD